MKKNTARRSFVILMGIGLSFASATALCQSTSQLLAPAYAPGVSGHVVQVVPPTPGSVCPAYGCPGPAANATVQLLNKSSGKLVGQAITNQLGNFIATVPAGSYTAHVIPAVTHTSSVAACHDVSIVVTTSNFTDVTLSCIPGLI
jgi:hypothetical protein